ncbi:MAG: hypothetical protein AAF384_04275 [Pseudomonadota bacterium]
MGHGYADEVKLTDYDEELEVQTSVEEAQRIYHFEQWRRVSDDLNDPADWEDILAGPDDGDLDR